MKEPTLLMLLLALCGTQAEVGQVCVQKAQCAVDECCQIINIVVASKKRQLLPELGPVLIGTCQRYRQEGDHCDSIEVMNGYCGCASGLTCRTLHEGSRRGALPPGYVQRCLP